MSENTGHGHVRPRPDGVRARCGGPGVCAACSLEYSQLAVEQARADLRIKDHPHRRGPHWPHVQACDRKIDEGSGLRGCGARPEDHVTQEG